MSRGHARPFVLAALVVAGGCRATPKPFPQATIVVDTDLPVPQLAGRLRVDVFDGARTFIESREYALLDPSAYPASFSVYLPDEDATGDVLVRLRLRPDGADRDYRGERYRAFPDDTAADSAVASIPTGDGQPRLVSGTIDLTPTTEPEPTVAVDRLVDLQLAPGDAKRVRVTLRADCVGHMASLADETTCVDAANPSVPAGPGDGADDGSPSLVAGVLASAASDIPPSLPTGAVLIPAGAFVLGGDSLDIEFASSDIAPHYPPHAAVIRAFAIDRVEVSVAAMRDALAHGFDPPFTVPENPGPLATTSTNPVPLSSCTFIAAPDPSDPERETLPVSCVAYDTARAYCQMKGGDLPTEAQWEYAAAAAGRAVKTRYPWGETEQTCAGVVYARFDDLSPGNGDSYCHDQGFPFGVRGAAQATLDTTPNGVRSMGGVVYEWARGAALAYDSACWLRAGIADPVCEVGSPATRIARGGSFTASPAELVTTFRGVIPVSLSTPQGGFRCVYAP